jgi:hypothetical protein
LPEDRITAVIRHPDVATAPNSPVRATAFQRIQQTQGNRAAQRSLTDLETRNEPHRDEPRKIGADVRDVVPDEGPAEPAARRGKTGVPKAGTGGKEQKQGEGEKGAAATRVDARRQADGKPEPVIGEARRGAAPRAGAAAPAAAVEPEAAGVEPADGPLRIDPVEPLVLQRIVAAFGPPLALTPDSLPLPALPGDAEASTAERYRNARAAAQESYVRTARAGRDKFESLVRESNASAETLRDAMNAALQRAITMVTDASAAVDAEYDARVMQLDAAATGAEAAVEQGSLAARKAITSTAAWAEGRLTAAHKAADGQIDAMLKEIIEPFHKTITDALTAVAKSGGAATKAISEYLTGHEQDYPLETDAENAARHEAIRAKAPKAISQILGMLLRAVPEATAAYVKLGADTTDQVKKNVRPPLDKHKDAIAKEGKAAVRRTTSELLKQVKEQDIEARKTIRDIQKNGAAQLKAQRTAARARLQGVGRRVTQGLRSEADSAVGGLRQSTRTSMTMYERSVNRMADGLKRAAGDGPDTLEHVGGISGADIERSLTIARRQQADAIAGNHRRAMGSFERRESDATTEARVERSDVVRAFAESGQQNATAMQDVAERHAAAFTSIGEGVARAAEGWTKPFAKVFPSYVKDSIAANKESHKTWDAEVVKGKNDFTKNLDRHVPARDFFKAQFEPIGEAENSRLNKRVQVLTDELFATFNTTESAVTGALHGLTAIQGRAVEVKFARSGYDLRWTLRQILWDNDYNAAINYLEGNRVEGARWELKESIHWYNDEESRIEQTMRDLTPAERAQLGETKFGQESIDEVRDALDGTDLNVFDALQVGNDARADAYRMKDRILETRKDEDLDAFNEVLAQYSRAPADWTGREVSAEERRRAVQQEFAAILDGVAADQPAAKIDQKEAEDKLLTFALQELEANDPPPPRGPGEPAEIPQRRLLKVEGAQRDLAVALVRKGDDSLDARTARLGVEFQRPGQPKTVNLDRALIDPRLNPNYEHQYSPAEKAQALKDRDEMFRRFATTYLPADPAAGEKLAQQRTEEAFQARFKDDHLKADLTTRWIREPHPTPETAALALRVAQKGNGTDEELANRTVERMNRNEIAVMRTAYREQTKSDDYPNGRDLYADLGVFGHRGEWFTELSGDEALRFEVKLLGIPQNDQQRAEVAFLEAQQQMEETGFLGKALASGTVAERNLERSYAELQKATGGSVRFDAAGNPIWTGGLFNQKGDYTGSNRRELDNAIQLAQLAAQSYAAKIDSYANAATMAIAIVGAIVAAAVTVATGGGASPLLLGAIAGITGLASMAAHKAISGGRYGWEQAMTDLGMTAIQALTAGIGQKLSLISRGGAAAQAAIKTGTIAQAGRITGHAFTDMVAIGAATGSLNALGQAALSEQTWDKGLSFAIDELFSAFARGLLSGGATAAVSNAFEALPLGRAVQGLPRQTLATKFGQSTNPALRGGFKAVSSGIGGFTGRGVELGFEKGRGRYRGDAGDILVASTEAAAQAAAQGFGEGAAEARAQAFEMRRQQQRLEQADREGLMPRPDAEDPLLAAARVPGTSPPSSDVPLVPKPVAAPDAAVPTAAPRPAAAPEATVTPPRPEAPEQAAAPTRPGTPTPEIPPPAPRAPREATDEASFADFDSLVKELRNSPFGYELEAAKRRPPGALAEDLTRTREQVDAAAHAAARRAPPAGQVPGAQIQHQTKTLDVTVKLPAGMPPLHPDVINENLLWLQSRKELPATLMLVDPTGKPTRYFIDDMPRGGWHDVGGRSPQLDLFTPAGRVREPDYNTEHKFTDNYLIPAAAQQIVEARRRAGLPPLDPRMLAIAAGEQARWMMEGITGTTRSGVVVDIEGQPRQVARPIPPVEQLPLRFPTGQEGTAAGIAGSSFAGDAAAKLGILGAKDRDVDAAVKQLAAPDGIFARDNATIPDPNDTRRVQITTQNDERVTVRFEMVTALAPTGTGEVPVAKFTKVGDREYVVQVSKGARPESVEQAVAHELREITKVHATTEEFPDALAPRSKATTLSPHDYGGLAQVEVLARSFMDAPLDSPRQKALLDEAQRLVTHLGLTGESEGVAARQQLARDALGAGLARALLDNAIETARNNPFLQRLTGEFTDDLRLLARRLEHAESISEDPKAIAALRKQLVAIAHQLIVREDNIIAKLPTEQVAGAVHFLRVNALKETLSPAGRSLLQEAIASATKALGKPEDRHRPEDPASLDPHTTAAVRALFSDQKEPPFQDWPDFKARYLENNPSLNRDDPRVLRRMYEQWAMGSYVAEDTGRARSLLSGVDRPSPGYEHRFVADPAPRADLKLPLDQIVTIVSKGGAVRDVSVDQVTQERTQTLRLAADKRRAMNETDDVNVKAQLKAEIKVLMQSVRDISEALGVAAGKAFAQEGFGDSEMVVMRGGGVPDVLIKRPPDGPIVVIECKGGTSELGTRMSADGTVRVEQGTREYLVSLATEMSQSDNAKIKEYGQLLLKQLDDPKAPPTQYFLVRQPYDESGRVGEPQVGTFDTSGKRDPSAKRPKAAGK